MRYFALVIAILLLPIGGAISDLTIYSEASYDSKEMAPVLVEWFHGSNDDEDLENLVKMDRSGDITLLHWRTGAEEEGGGLPDDDANTRLTVHGGTITPFPRICSSPCSITTQRY